MKYDPFQYSELMNYFYEGGHVPGTVRHIAAVGAFNNWTKKAMPRLHSSIRASDPQSITDPASALPRLAVSSLVAHRDMPNSQFLAGLGQDLDFIMGDEPGTPKVQSPGILTEWGSGIMDLAKSVVQYDAQRKVLEANIRRAEQGLPPLDSSEVGMGVSVGMSPQVQKLAMAGLGIAAVLGGMYILSNRRK